MREEIAYQEMQEETAREARDQPSPDPSTKTPQAADAAAPGGSQDPTRKERAYPDLPSEGVER